MTTTVADPTTQAATATEPRDYLWTTNRFYRAADAGVFDDPARLELIHGRIIEKMPISPLHTALTNIIADTLRAVLSPPLTVRAESALHIDFDGEPIPDVSAVMGSNRDYLTRHPAPQEALLLVEIAVTSAEYDLGGKALLYAQAGIEDYWVVLPETWEIVVHRGPTAEGFGSVTRLSETEAIAPLAAPEALLLVRDLLGRSVEDAPSGVNPV